MHPSSKATPGTLDSSTYVKDFPGAIGHCETLGTPSYSWDPYCKNPCQCSVVPSSGPVIVFVNFTNFHQHQLRHPLTSMAKIPSIQSPQLASMSGAGNCPLISRPGFAYPSVETVPRFTVKSYRRVTPVLGMLGGVLSPGAGSFHGHPPPYYHRVSMRNLSSGEIDSLIQALGIQLLAPTNTMLINYVACEGRRGGSHFSDAGCATIKLTCAARLIAAPKSDRISTWPGR